MNPYEFDASIRKRGLRRKDIAKLLEISDGALSRKLNGKSGWNINQVQTLKKELDLTDSEVKDIFLI